MGHYPTLNTAPRLLASGVTITIAHHSLERRGTHRGGLIFWLAATFILGFVFLGFQAYEYIHLYTEGKTSASTPVSTAARSSC